MTQWLWAVAGSCAFVIYAAVVNVIAWRLLRDPVSRPMAMAPGSDNLPPPPPYDPHEPPWQPVSPRPGECLSSMRWDGHVYTWRWWLGDWNAFLPSLAARVTAGRIPTEEACGFIGTICARQGLPEAEALQLAQRLMQIVDQEADRKAAGP